MGKSTISLAIFHSYVTLPEGNLQKTKHLDSGSTQQHPWFLAKFINHPQVITMLTGARINHP